MTSFCFFVQLADRTLILKQKEFFVFMIASRLFLNHSPSEWFSLYNDRRPTEKSAGRALLAGMCAQSSGGDSRQMSSTDTSNAVRSTAPVSSTLM